MVSTPAVQGRILCARHSRCRHGGTGAARGVQLWLGAGTAARRGYGRDKRGPPVWRRAISLRNRSARLICGVSAREVPAPPSARGVQLWLGAGTAARRGYGRDKRGPPVWHRAISLRNHSDAIYSTPLHGHSSTDRFDTDRWCTPTDGVFLQQNHEEYKRFANFVSFFSSQCLITEAIRFS